MRTSRTWWSALLVCAAVAVGAACSGASNSGAPVTATAAGGGPRAGVGPGLSDARDDFKADDGRLRVATTVAPLSSIVLNVGGSLIRVHGLIPDGVDSHTYEPRPSDAEVLGRADMLIMNGANLEGTTERIALQNLRDPARIYKLADHTLAGDDPATGFLYDFSFPRSDGSPNPHLWMNPLYAMRYADLVRGWLTEHDPDHAADYQENYDRFAAVLRALDGAIAVDRLTVPVENRKLLTYHDSWAYWARRYDWHVIGAIQPSDLSEPSAKDLVDLITQIRRERVPAIFGSEVFPSTTLEAISRETGAVYEEKLRDDSPPGAFDDVAHTYIGMLVEDMQIMFDRLGGSAARTAKVPVENTAR
ncbi:MAG: metal ABC transporter substrate-binding protein [Chloroflexi bacterium]|nr:metal ABC transporter substrate-binding protein [Chloroflexota bacterium]MDA1003533.1 metal ABC transporter substrate-binding protein [Chloroflexota bacterium]MQC27877.1 zinc ABC transporter substrate-binding protein [Chloroflexota bacterium]